MIAETRRRYAFTTAAKTTRQMTTAIIYIIYICDNLTVDPGWSGGEAEDQAGDERQMQNHVDERADGGGRGKATGINNK